MKILDRRRIVLAVADRREEADRLALVLLLARDLAAEQAVTAAAQWSAGVVCAGCCGVAGCRQWRRRCRRCRRLVSPVPDSSSSSPQATSTKDVATARAATRSAISHTVTPPLEAIPGRMARPAQSAPIGAIRAALPDGNGMESHGRFRPYHISCCAQGKIATDKIRQRIGAVVAEASNQGGVDRGEHRAQRDRQGVRQRFPCRAQVVARRRRRRVLGARRTVGLRQVDRAADDRRARDDHVGRAAHRRQGRERPRAQGPRHRDGVPVVRAVSAPHRARQHRLRAQVAEDAQGRDQRARRRRRRGSSSSPRTSTASRVSCRVASASVWRWAARSCASRRRS